MKAAIGMVWGLALRVMTGASRSVRAMFVIDLLTYTVSIPGALRTVAIVLVVTAMADGEAWFGRVPFWSRVSITTVSANVIGFFQ